MQSITRHALKIIGFATLSFTAAAQAQTSSAPELPEVSFIGSGCPEGDTGTQYHWEGSSLVFNFSKMVAEKGTGISLTQSRKTCSITINLNLPKGLSYSLGGYAARGNDDLADDDTRTLTVTNFFQGDSANTTLSDDALGPVANDFSSYHLNTGAEYLWSPCNSERAHTVTAAIRIGNGSDRAASSVATLETLRLPIRLKLCASVFNQ